MEMALGGPQAMIREVENTQPTGCTAPRIFRLRRHEPEAYARASVLFLVHNYVNRLPATPEEIRVTGGLARSRVWCQVLADVFQAETVPVRGEGAAAGAAVLDETRRCIPDPARTTVNRALSQLFRALTRRLRGLEGEDIFLLRRKLTSLDTHGL